MCERIVRRRTLAELLGPGALDAGEPRRRYLDQLVSLEACGPLGIQPGSGKTSPGP